MSKQQDAINEANEFYVYALLLAEVVKRILLKKGNIVLSSKPTLTLKPITEFIKHMRIVGLEKFDEKTYISTVNFYENEKKEKSHKAIGAIVLYVPESYVSTLVNQLGYPDVDDDEEDVIEDAVGTLCNLIAGGFKTGLTQLDYKELIFSHFSTYQNEVLNGVEYHPSQKQLYEISFEVKGEKVLVADLTMAPVPRYKFQ